MQPCHTFNKKFTHEFFQENTYKLGDDYDPTNKVAAFEKSLEFGLNAIPLGVIYKEDKPSYESQLPQITEKPLVGPGLQKRDVTDLFKHHV